MVGHGCRITGERTQTITLDLAAAVMTAAGRSGQRTRLLGTVDISAGGALFRSERGLPLGMDAGHPLQCLKAAGQGGD